MGIGLHIPIAHGRNQSPMTILSHTRFAALAFGFACAALLSLPAAAQDARRFFDATLGDFRAELTAAREQNKTGVLLVFEMEGCPFCRRMRENVFNRPDVQDYFRRHFLVFTVDVLGDVSVHDFRGREMREKDFAREAKVRGTPTFVFVDLSGEVMTRFSGATRSPAEFLALGQFVVDGAYRSRSFEQYLQRRN